MSHYTIHSQEESGPIYSDIKKEINEVKQLEEDYLRRGFEAETHIDLSGEKNEGENAMIICPNCDVGLPAKVWDAYTAKVEGYNPDEMFGLSRGGLAKHREFDTQYRCPTCMVR